MFVDSENHDYYLRLGSPALEIGFQPIEFGEAGVYGEATWIEQAAPSKMPKLELAP